MPKKFKKVVVSDIVWDAPKTEELPKEVVIDIIPGMEYLLDEIDTCNECISDYLSDQYGWCVKGFALSCD